MSKASFIKELSLPVIAAPMFLISGPQLVIECCKNGIIGTFPALNQRTSEGFEEWLIEIKTVLLLLKRNREKAAPFGVNIIVHHSNPRVEADLALCVKHKVPLIITSLGAVSELVETVHNYGVWCFMTSLKASCRKSSRSRSRWFNISSSWGRWPCRNYQSDAIGVRNKKFFKKPYY